MAEVGADEKIFFHHKSFAQPGSQAPVIELTYVYIQMAKNVCYPKFQPNLAHIINNDRSLLTTKSHDLH